MDEQHYKTALIDTFDTVSEGYDNEALRFFSLSAEHMALLLGLRGDEKVLDVGCGTGHASLAIAKRLTTGRVTAVDFSPGMLKQAQRKANSLDLCNIDFIEGNIQNMSLLTRHFDIAVCAFSIFFVEDMKTLLAHITSAVRSNGTVMISHFQDSFLSPLREMFFDHIEAYGIARPPMTWKRISSEELCRELFEQAGLREIHVEQKNFGYFLKNEEQWWEVIWNAGMRGCFSLLNSLEGERFKREHLGEIKALQTAKGIWLDAGILFTWGIKP